MKAKNLKRPLLFLLVVFCLLSSLFTSSMNFVFAEDITYSNVLEDLQKDENFKVELYPVIENVYSLEVIQLAEGSDKELLVYVYQPSGESKDLRATEIRMSTGINDNAKWEDYSLKLLSKEGTLYKYQVENFVVKEDALRYYDVSAIFRKWDKDIDPAVGGDNTAENVPFEVGNLWTFCTVNGQVSYSCTKTEVVEITGKYVGFIRYSNGFILHQDACDSHFVAFSTDKEIDSLLEAEVDFITQSFVLDNDSIGGGMLMSVDETVSVASNDDYRYGEEKSETVTVTYDQEETVSVGFIFKKKYSFNRIEKVTDFVANEDYDLSSIAKDEMVGKQWVLRFTETDYNFKMTSGISPTISESGTKVKEVTIMRLKFETNGVVYNLGVVDNKQTGSDKPAGETPTILDQIMELLGIFFWILLAIAILVLIGLIPGVFNIIVTLLIWVGKALWWLITIPFEIFKDKDD